MTGRLVVGGLKLATEGHDDSTLKLDVGSAFYSLCLLFVAVAELAPLSGSLAPRRRVIGAAYGVALTEVAVGVVLATAMLAGYGPIVERWALLKPAHAWLNVFGFLSVVIATLASLSLNP